MSINHEMIHDLVQSIQFNPIAVDPNAPTLPMTIDQFRQIFNDTMLLSLKKFSGDNEHLQATMKKFMLIGNAELVRAAELDFMPNFFADKAALMLAAAPGGGKLRLLTYAHTRAASPAETTMLNLIRSTIFATLLPNVDVNIKQASFVQDGLAVSNSRVGKLFLMTVTAA